MGKRKSTAVCLVEQGGIRASRPGGYGYRSVRRRGAARWVVESSQSLRAGGSVTVGQTGEQKSSEGGPDAG